VAANKINYLSLAQREANLREIRALVKVNRLSFYLLLRLNSLGLRRLSVFFLPFSSFLLFPFHSSASREPFDSVPVPESVRRIMEKKIKMGNDNKTAKEIGKGIGPIKET